MSWLDDDVSVLFSDFGLKLEAEDGTETEAIFDEEDIVETDVGGAQLFTREHVLRIATGSLAEAVIADGKELTFDGTTVYRVRDRRLEEDGKTTALIVVTVP